MIAIQKKKQGCNNDPEKTKEKQEKLHNLGHCANEDKTPKASSRFPSFMAICGVLSIIPIIIMLITDTLSELYMPSMIIALLIPLPFIADGIQKIRIKLRKKKYGHDPYDL